MPMMQFFALIITRVARCSDGVGRGSEKSTQLNRFSSTDDVNVDWNLHFPSLALSHFSPLDCCFVLFSRLVSSFSGIKFHAFLSRIVMLMMGISGICYGRLFHLMVEEPARMKDPLDLHYFASSRYGFLSLRFDSCERLFVCSRGLPGWD